MTGLVQVADISDFMFELREDETEAPVSQSVTPSKNRNVTRFPEQFRLQFTQSENEQLVTICDQFANLKHPKWCAFSRMEMSAVTMLAKVMV